MRCLVEPCHPRALYQLSGNTWCACRTLKLQLFANDNTSLNINASVDPVQVIRSPFACGLSRSTTGRQASTIIREPIQQIRLGIVSPDNVREHPVCRPDLTSYCNTSSIHRASTSMHGRSTFVAWHTLYSTPLRTLRYRSCLISVEATPVSFRTLVDDLKADDTFRWCTLHAKTLQVAPELNAQACFAVASKAEPG